MEYLRVIFSIWVSMRSNSDKEKQNNFLQKNICQRFFRSALLGLMD